MSAVIRPPRGKGHPSPGYDTDFAAWAFAEADKLRRLAASGAAGDLDVENIVEELESLGRQDRREIASRLTVLLAHLLKCRVQPEKISEPWRATLLEQRKRIKDLLDESPSLYPYPLQRLQDGKDYEIGRARAAVETGLPESAFPATCPFTIDQILDDSFFG